MHLRPGVLSHAKSAIVYQVAQTYREELKGNLQGPAGDEAARMRIENWANATLQSDLMVRVWHGQAKCRVS